MKIAIISITIFVLCFSSIIFGYFSYPPQGNNDGAWFIVPGVNYSINGRFENPIDWGQGDLRLGNGPFLSYPPLFPIFLSFFISPNSHLPIPVQIFIIIGIINCIVISLSGLILYKVATIKNQNLSWLAAIFICTSLLLLFKASWSFGARPEILVRLFFTIGLVSILFIKKNWVLAGVLGVLLGLTVSTHVLAPFLFFAFVILLSSLKYEFSSAIKFIFFVLGIGILTYFLIMQLSPYGIFETLKGTYQHGKLMLNRLSPEGAGPKLFQSFNLALYGGISIILSFFIGVKLLRKSFFKKIPSPLLFFTSGLAAFIYVIFVVADTRNYYVAPFLLILFIVILFYATNKQSSRLIKFCLSAFVVVLAIFALKNFVLFKFFIDNGTTLFAARDKAAEIISQNPDKIIMLGGSRLWMLSEEYDRVLMDIPRADLKLGEYLYFLEEEEIPRRPDVVYNCALKNNYYISQAPQLFGFSLAETIPGYGFAVYECHS